jgi:tetratricopeptide (TPR) repeat protein
MRKLTTTLTLTIALLAGASSTAAPSPGFDVALEQAKSLLGVDTQAAEAAIERALELAPDDAEVQFHCGRIMGARAEEAFFRALGYASRSLACLQRAVELRPTHVPYRRGLMAYYLGAPGIAGGDESLAWAEVETISTMDPRAGALAALSFHRETENETAYATLLSASRARFPEVAELHLRDGLLLQERKDYDGAHAAFVQASALLETSNDDGGRMHALNALYQIGRNAVFSGDHTLDGVAAMQRFIEQPLPAEGVPPKEWGYLRLAQLLHRSGQPEQARRYADLARTLDDRQLHRELRKLGD